MDSKLLHLGIILLFHLLLAEATIYLTDTHMKRMIEMTANNQPCRVHYDRSVIQSVLAKIDPRHVQRVNSQTLNDLSSSCRDADQINKTGGFIFPGTKWCGPGTIANGYNDLGLNSNEDRCCREHDHCSNQLEPGQCRHGICNISPFTRSHCDCDEVFKRCLHDVNSDVANIIGSLYFNVAQVTCFKERRSCPQSLSDCRLEFQQIQPYLSRTNRYFRYKEKFLAGLFSGLVNGFYHPGGYKGRDNLSYSWFCEEWKFMPTDYFTPSLIQRANQTYHVNDIPDEGRVKSREPSKIDRDLETIFGKEDEITKIMSDYKTLRN